MDKTAIIVGTTSMLGGRLAERLEKDGYYLLSCGRASESDIFLDLGADECVSVPDGLRADVLFHCAASFKGDHEAGAWQNEMVNALACLSVATVATRTACKQVVHASSISCYPHPATGDVSSYGGSKARGESILEWALGRADISLCSLRFSQLYDDYGDAFKHQAWFRRITAYARAGRDLHMPPSPHRQNFLHVDDAVGLMSAAAAKQLSGMWPATHPVSLSYMAIARTAYEVFDRGGDPIESPKKRPFTEQCIPDSSQLFERLGLCPVISMKEGLERLKTQCKDERFGVLDVE